MASSLSVVGGFFLRCILWLAPLLALWFWAGDWVVRPSAWLAEQVMFALFPEWVLGVQIKEGMSTLVAAFQSATPGGQVAELEIEVNALKYAHGLPLLLALLLGSRARGVWWKFPVGAIILVAVQAWGIVFDWLVYVSIHVSDLTRAQTGFGELHANLFGLGMQFGYLVLPTLVPLLIWFGFERQFLRSVILEGALDGLVRVGRVRH